MPLAGVALLSTPAAAQSLRSLTCSKQYHGQTTLKARVEFAAGTLHLTSAPTALLYRMALSYDQSRFVPVSRYDASADALVLGLTPTGSGGIRVDSKDHLAQEATIQLSSRPDLSLGINIGAADADVDLGGLRLHDLQLATGASRTTVRFSTPNPGRCEVMSLNAGAAEFAAAGLGNSRCRRVLFEGGVGAVALDLTGAWADDAEIAVKIAVGKLALRLPLGVGVRITMDKFLSSFQPSGFTHDGKVYLSDNYATAARKLSLNVTSAVGGVEVEWR
jgi:hypothetical protein